MQQLILLIIAILAFGLSFVLLKWPGGRHMTFSQHAAADRWSKVFYASLFLVALPLLFWFFDSWFVPEKRLPATFLWLAAIAILFQIACTLIPETGGTRTRIHRILTGISGFAMLPLVAMIAAAQSLPALVRFSTWAALLIMIVLLGIALKNQKGHRWALMLQIGYYAAFFIVILIATYVS